MQTYPFTPSQQATATAADLLAFIKSPTLLARRFGEILTAQQFIGLFLLTGRYTLQGGAIAVPSNEKIRTDRTAEGVAPGAEYKLTPLSAEQYEVYTGSKEGIATEIVDEEIGRSLRQPIDDALTLLQTELVFDANELALGVIQSSVTQTLAAGAAWTNGKQILKDALRVQAASRRLKLGYAIDTVVLPSEQYAEIMPELIDILPDNDNTALTGAFPTISGITWVSSDGDDISDPIFVDRRRLGGIARETIPSPEYRQVGGDTGVEVASIREPKADKTRLQARNPHVPVVTNPLAGFVLTGTGA
ncbi:major capsid protein [Arthrobacter phage Elesar]|uniref:Major capsid protein n=1 Tax=Arthrobacter phage Elesar TaxID=2510522 RepID=A0A411CQ69_9CAUD|nr:major capsid protein [Arthrobacter phage Elesar]QAY16061.1 major capsid protein [Arthrobacter phage Elesar]